MTARTCLHLHRRVISALKQRIESLFWILAVGVHSCVPVPFELLMAKTYSASSFQGKTKGFIFKICPRLFRESEDSALSLVLFFFRAVRLSAL